MKYDSGVEATGVGMLDILQAVAELSQVDVMVGIPHGEAREEGITNAQIGYLMEFGSPSQNIPARPFLAPGVEKVQDKTTELLLKATSAAFDGNIKKMEVNLNRAGSIAASAVKLHFIEGTFAPLSLATIRARANRGRTGAKKYLKQIKVGPPEEGLVRPLIDTAELRKSVIYMVMRKGEEV